MADDEAAGPAALSVILPASNEAALIGGCLRALAASEWDAGRGPVEVIVIANGCRDDTAARAGAEAPRFAARGWHLRVLERAEPGKPGALNAGDAAASAGMRVYLDADVTVGKGLLVALHHALDTKAPRYASGRVEIAAGSRVSRAYARIWRQVPFMRRGVPGCGVFAVNAAGRARWGAFPDIISDDTFVRLSFSPRERVAVPDLYRWPIAEGLPALIRVRRRQDAGVAEIAARYPALLANDDKPPFPWGAKLRLVLRNPLSFAVYSGVALAVKLTPRRNQGWSRGR